MAEIREDSLVRYKGTGTIGTVKVLLEDDGVTWPFWTATGLYYRLGFLELIEKAPERKELEGMTLEQIPGEVQADARYDGCSQDAG